jgi:hypothetical protein
VSAYDDRTDVKTNPNEAGAMSITPEMWKTVQPAGQQMRYNIFLPTSSSSYPSDLSARRSKSADARKGGGFAQPQSLFLLSSQSDIVLDKSSSTAATGRRKTHAA